MPHKKVIAERLVNTITTELKKAERSQKGKVCIRMQLDNEETVAILTNGKLPPEIMVMFNNAPIDRAMPLMLNDSEVIWHELSHKDKGCQDATTIREGLQGLPNIQIELWATRFVPYFEGKRRYVKATADTYSYAYSDK